MRWHHRKNGKALRHQLRYLVLQGSGVPKHLAQIKLAPSDTTAINIDGYDGPTSTQFRYCVRVRAPKSFPTTMW
jgi:hypothetical protein